VSLGQALDRSSGPQAIPTAGGRLGTWVKLAFLLAVLVFGTLFVVRRWAELSAVFGRLSWPPLLIAVALAGMAQLAAMNTYRAITSDLGEPLPIGPASRVYFVSQLGKYLPGMVWGMVALVTLSREYRVARKVSFATGLLTAGFSVAIAVLFAVLLLPFGAPQSAHRFWYVGLLVPLLPIGLHPSVVGTVIDTVLRRLGRQPLPQRMSYTGTLRTAGWQSLSWLLFGLHACALVVALGGTLSAATLAVGIGGFALSYGIGPLFVLLPAGAGVREAALVLTLGAAVGGATALAVALVSRVVLVIADFAQAGLWSAAARRTVPAEPAAD
jgi:uncharacterized membrane protein YbhN (UPF0104 family)